LQVGLVFWSPREEHKMNLTSDYPFWSIRSGLPASYPSPDRDLICDVVVVGAGITGALTGFHLAQAGVATVLVDRREIGTGSIVQEAVSEIRRELSK
jgi:NADPH-dependent 2,4-dienoyl-CoA reductase/sulfur reductase-like enzyme